MSPAIRAVVLIAVSAMTVYLVVDPRFGADRIEVAGPSRGETVNGFDAGDQSLRDRLTLRSPGRDPFVVATVVQKTLPPPVAPSPPPPVAVTPSAPPPPFKYFGRMTSVEGKQLDFVDANGKLLALSKGQTIDDFQVEEVRPTEIVVRHVPTQTDISVPIPQQ